VQTFREQVPGVLERYQRRTMRLTGQVSAGVRKNVAGPGWSARVLGGLINEYERAAQKLRSGPVPEYWNPYRRRLPGDQHARYQETLAHQDHLRRHGPAHRVIRGIRSEARTCRSSPNCRMSPRENSYWLIHGYLVMNGPTLEVLPYLVPLTVNDFHIHIIPRIGGL